MTAAWHDGGRPPSAKLTAVMVGRKQASEDAQAKYLADVALAADFDSLLSSARAAEQQFRTAQATAAPLTEQYQLARALDEALTGVMRSAYAAMRAEIGPRGYDDRIFRRKAMATPQVHALHAEAERLLTLRETHRLTGFPPRPEGIGLPDDTTAPRGGG
jgi:site-specific DNA-cytosine methylase